MVRPELHPEQGTVWRWIYDHDKEVFGRFSPAYMRHGRVPCAAWTRSRSASCTASSRRAAAWSSSKPSSAIRTARRAETGRDEGADEAYMMERTFTTNSNEHY